MKPFFIFIVSCVCFVASSAQATNINFHTWLAGVRQEAIHNGISPNTVDRAFANAQFLPKVIELDRKQPETTITFQQYLNNVVTQARIQKARRLYQENRVLLETIGKRYGVQPRFIVALWGIESNFGENTGGFSIINSLATLGYEGRRSTFFRAELINALKILDQGHISVAEMKGSWAGAMGQTQFMPSSFLKFAVDYDGNGKRDIWHSKADAFASIANYLASVGWDDEYTWGRQVTVPAAIDSRLVDIKKEKNLQAWRREGIQPRNGGILPDAPIQASLIRPHPKDNLYYLAYPNYKVVLKWNRSLYFATAVGIFSDAIGR